MRIFANLMTACLCLFGLSSLPSIAEASDAELFGRIIQGIDYAASRPLDRSHYDPYLGIKPGDPLTRSGIKKAIQSLYDSGQFFDIVAAALPDGEGVRIRFDLQHNSYFNRFSIDGKLNLGGRSLWELISLPAGQRFTPEKLEEARQAVLKFMRDQGFYQADARARLIYDDQENQVDTVFIVMPGNLPLISSVVIKGMAPQEVGDIQNRLGIREGRKFDRVALGRRLDKLKNYFISRGYLAATVQISELFQTESNTIALEVGIANFGRIRVAVEGFKIDKDQLPRLLPVLTGEGVEENILQEGLGNIRDYLEERGYPDAEVTIRQDTDKSGVRVVHYQINSGRGVAVAFVRFSGNHNLTDEKLLNAVQIQPAHFLQKSVYSASRLDGDVALLKSLYQSKGYLDARILPLIQQIKDGEKLGITYQVEEGPLSTTLSVTLQGNQALTSAALVSGMRLKAGSPYSPALAEQSRQDILAAYNDAGFPLAQVTYRVGDPAGANSYPVEFTVNEGIQHFVDRVIVLGNRHTRDSVIKKRIDLKQEAPLSLGKMLQTQQKLYNLGVFDLVRVAPQNPESVAAYQDVMVQLEEAKRYTLRYGLGYQAQEHLRGTVELSDLNFLGWGRRADLRLRGSSIEQAGVLSFQQPQFRFLSVDSYLSFTALQRQDVSFDTKRFNLSYQFGHSINNHTWGLLRYSLQNVRVFNLKVSISELGREDTPRNLSTISAVYVNDTRDNQLDPVKGFFTSTDFSFTSMLRESNDYCSLYTQNSYFRKLPGSLLLAASFRFGSAHPFGGDTTLPISERFFAGGSSSLRGFATDFAGPLDPNTHHPVGGNALIIGNLEIKVPLLRAFQIAGFYDTGNVFRNLTDISLSGFSHTAGMGIRLKTPFGSLRADYGYNLNLSSFLRQSGLMSRGHFFITIGPTF
jgi:outer membrane protein insertion porin family